MAHKLANRISGLLVVCLIAALLALGVHPGRASAADTATPPAPSTLKVMTYFPASGGWAAMWSNYSHTQTDSDMQSIRSLGANTVRIIVNPYALGWPKVNATGQQKLDDVITTAENDGLQVELTLFDQWSLYSDISDSSSWLTQALSKYAGDSHIVLVEIQNEIDSSDPAAMAWARAELAYLPTVLPGVPRTLSVPSELSTANLSALLNGIPASLLDVVDVHLYQSADSNASALTLAESMAAGRPVIVGESGRSSGPNSTVTTERAQAKYYTEIVELCHQFGISYFTPWILSDFATGGTLAGMPAAQSSFGLRRLDGTWKPAASVVESMFAQSPITSAATPMTLTQSETDGTFEDDPATPSSTGSLGFWQVTDRSDLTAKGAAGISAGNGVNGSSAGFLSGTGGSSSGWPALSQEFPLAGKMRSVTFSAQARVVDGLGSTTKLSIAWFANNAYIGQVESPNASPLLAGWQQLSVAGTAPTAATSFQVFLKSAFNQGTAYFDNASIALGTGVSAGAGSNSGSGAAPAVTSIAPAAGTSGGGTTVTITGSGFTGATKVFFSGVAAASFTVVSDTKITALTPAQAPATRSVYVTTAGGTSPYVAAAQFTYLTPSIWAVAPAAGLVTGATAVTLTGSGFTGATSLTFGGVAASNFTVVSDTTITAISPSHSAGSSSVVVGGPGGTTGAAASATFDYQLPVSTIVAVSPTSGPTTGGTTITFTGTHFTGATNVTFSGVPAANFTVVSDTTITAVTPPQAAATHSVYVTTAGGTSPYAPASQFTYVVVRPAAPAVTAISATSGPTTGGTTITITGTHFTGATNVTFSGVPAANFTVVSDTTITAVTPPQAAATHSVYVTTAGGTSPYAPASQFTYVVVRPAAPAVTAISATSGPTTGGTTITITGTHFTGATNVTFSGVPAANFTVVSDTTITAVTPPQAAATHSVYVTTAGGTSPYAPASQFTYVR